ncbi:MAG TPA: DUF1015 domain-containing protein [Thermoanaerobaculia bacterium]|nr:DUF1015 domain-containing protein [Thermoanaerobaculia bacterium]
MELRPFRSIRFSPRVLKARGLAAVFAPPYDQISPLGQERLYASAPENIVRVTYRRRDDGDVYEGAAGQLSGWLADGTLEKERRPALWIYRQTFTDGGETVVRNALVGLVRLAEYAAGTVRPHERTLAKPKADRLALLGALKADLELVFLMTRAPLTAVLGTRRTPQLSATDPDGVRHDAFRISDYAAHVELQGLVKNAEAIIADGHHRYETALAFSKDPAAAKLPGARYKLCAIVDMASPGLVVRPIHRLLSGIPAWNPARLLENARAVFDVVEHSSAVAALEALKGHSRIRPAFVLYAPPALPVLLTLRQSPPPLPWPEGRSDAWKGLDVSALEVAFFDRLLSIGTDLIARGENVSFTSDAAAAVAAVDRQEAQAAILMRATTVSDVEAVVGSGDRLPQKSTHFFPKMYSGIFGVSLEDAVY